MAEIDLIPREYSEGRRLSRRLRNFGLAMAAVAAATVIARGWIALRLADERPTVERMRQQVKLAVDRQSQLAALDARRTAAESRLAALHALRDNATWVAMFQAVDHAYNRNLWFDELAFSRIIQIESLPSGSPPDTNAASGRPATTPPRISDGFEIKGHALDHAAIGDFMRSIGEQPGVAGVRLSDTGLRRYSTIEVVDFSLAATLDPTGTVAR